MPLKRRTTTIRCRNGLIGDPGGRDQTRYEERGHHDRDLLHHWFNRCCNGHCLVAVAVALTVAVAAAAAAAACCCLLLSAAVVANLL